MSSNVWARDLQLGAAETSSSIWTHATVMWWVLCVAWVGIPETHAGDVPVPPAELRRMLLEDKDFVNDTEIVALGKRALPGIIEALERSDKRIEMERALWVLTRLKADTSKAFPAVEGLLKHKEKWIRIYAIQSLTELRGAAARERILDMTADDEEFVRVNAFRALAKIGDETTAQSVEDKLAEHMARLRSSKKTERDRAAQSILRHKQEMVTEIRKIVTELVHDKRRKGTVKDAIVLLGNFRDAESVPLLVEHLTFEVFYKQRKRPQTIEDRFPCVGALIEIGLPSIDGVLEKAQVDGSDWIARCGATVIARVLGVKWAVAYLEDRIQQQTEPARRERLARLLKYLEFRGHKPSMKDQSRETTIDR